VKGVAANQARGGRLDLAIKENATPLGDRGSIDRNWCRTDEGHEGGGCSLRSDPIFCDLHFVHTSEGEEELDQISGGASEVRRRMVPTASVTAAWKITEPT
jgi:hypothetical protein